MKTLYQIENSKSSRRVIYESFDKWRWSEGNGEDGTFFNLGEVRWILEMTKIDKNLFEYGGDCSILKYEISSIEKKDLEDKFVYPEPPDLDSEDAF